jgi:hypothetical protein
MKKWLIKPGLVLLALAFSHLPAHAQVPAIAVYFDRELTQTEMDCPGSPVVDTLYVAVFGFTSPVEGFEYKIDFPTQITFLGEPDPESGLAIGNSAQGRTLALTAPVDASTPTLIQEVAVLWLCDGCENPDNWDLPVTVVPHPGTTHLRAVTSDLAFVDMAGMTSRVCPTYVAPSTELVRRGAHPHRVAIAGAQCELTCPAGDGGVIVPGDPPPEVHTTDVDGDGVVWLYDFSWLFSAYLTGPTPDADFDCSGTTNLIDFVLFTRHWQHADEVPTERTSWGSVKERYRN